MAHEKRLLIDVFQAYFYRKDAKNGNKRELVFMSENLTSGSISTTQENTDVRNGQGNTLFAVLPGSKDVTVSLTENVFSFEALKLNTGVEQETGGNDFGVWKKIIHKAGRVFTVEELIPAPVPGVGGINDTGAEKMVELYPLEKPVANPDELEILIDNKKLTKTDKLSTLTNATFLLVNNDYELYDPIKDHENGCIILLSQDAIDTMATDFTILPYVYITSGTGTKTLTVSAKEFSEGGELWLQTLEKDEKQRPTAYVYFVFENAMPEGSFEISTVSEVQPNDMTVNMRILANESGELYRIVREEIPQ
jgi:hypothetical protein